MSDLPFLNDIPDPLADAATPPAPELAPPRPLDGSPTRPALRRRRAAAAALSIAWLAVHLSVFGLRADLQRLPPLYLAAQVLLPCVLGASCLVAALAPGKLGLGLGIGAVTSLALLAPLSFWLLALGMPAPHPPAAPANFWLASFVCLDITLAWAAAPLVLAALSLRRAFTAAASWRSGLVGGGIGLFSGAAINLHCPNVAPAHMIAGHAVPVAASALLGAFLVARWTRV